jgi:hypothetical protein
MSTDMSAQIAVDAGDPNTLWSHAQDLPTYRSTDGGNTWAEVTTILPDGVTGSSWMDTIDGGVFTSILAAPSGTGTDFVLRSDDGGQSFFKIPTPGNPDGVLFAGAPNRAVVKTYNGRSSIFRLDVRSNRWVDISPPGSGSITGLTDAMLGRKSVLFAYNPEAIYRYTGRL